MQVKIFTVPFSGGEAEADALNSFLAHNPHYTLNIDTFLLTSAK